MNKKLIFGAFMLFVSMINPGCKHEKINGKQLYQKYLRAHIKQ
jgi:hypothetical protein